jgi:DNA helicase-2/ATP-dependent DNA helicase PcrA
LISAGRAPLDPTGPEHRIISVRPDDRVLQIVAGPGSGKTEMLVWRVLYELLVLGADSRRVMVTTFTRKAATELTVRVVERSDALLATALARGWKIDDPHVHDLRIGTIHSLCDALLAEFDSEYVASGTQVIDEFETRVRLIRRRNYIFDDQLRDRILTCEPLVALFRAPWFGDYWPGNVADTVSYMLSLLSQHTETWIPRCAADGRPNGVEVRHRETGLTDDLVTLQALWEEFLDQQRLLDFATIQKRFLERQSSVLAELDHVFVDEFQDTNPIQYAIHRRWLDGADARLTVVGDDDQALYRFRGSDIQCFIGLEGDCRDNAVPYRRELLEINHRGTPTITRFANRFRASSALAGVSLDKHLRWPEGVGKGVAVRLLEGPWTALCDQLTKEIGALRPSRANRPSPSPPSVAVLMFSTSEKGTSPALDLRLALELAGQRVYNPRNKVAGRSGPVHDLFALLSYLIDPVTHGPCGKNGGLVMVWASHGQAAYASAAYSEAPEFRMNDGHAAIQKRFRKSGGGSIDESTPEIEELLDYVDDVRERLVNASTGGRRPRLTLAGLVARLLSFPYFRNVGFTVELFREGLFTTLLESNIAATRMSRTSLDGPIEPTVGASGKVRWPRQYWQFLNVFGMLMAHVDLDDPEVEEFADNAVALLTYHQAKGLEFDHVYVGMTGREASINTVLQTKLFSGEAPRYTITGGQPRTRDREVLTLAEADRDRELYVALTRARTGLTFFHAIDHDHPLMNLHDALSGLFARPGKPIRGAGGVTVRKA